MNKTHCCLYRVTLSQSTSSEALEFSSHDKVIVQQHITIAKQKSSALVLFQSSLSDKCWYFRHFHPHAIGKERKHQQRSTLHSTNRLYSCCKVPQFLFWKNWIESFRENFPSSRLFETSSTSSRRRNSTPSSAWSASRHCSKRRTSCSTFWAAAACRRRRYPSSSSWTTLKTRRNRTFVYKTPTLDSRFRR